MCLVIIPFATELLTAFIYSQDRYLVAIFYCAILMTVSILYNLLWCYASIGYRLISTDIQPYILKRMTIRYLISIPLYLFTLLVAAFNVEISLALNLIIALVYTFPTTFFQGLKRRSLFFRRKVTTV
jgi:hypothetical protein